MTDYLPGYDAWKTDSGREDDGDCESQCDCCAAYKIGCRDIVWGGMDTHACPACLGDDDPDRVREDRDELERDQ